MSVRVRFAPSPTGTLHLGSARSALYNWLYARHFGDEGTYVLRIEDTDQERSTPENVEQALRVFRWLGLTWDEGPGVGGPHEPYFQSQRYGRYTERLRELMDAGRAYECFCTKEQLEADREQAAAEKRPFVYTGRCRNLSPEEREQRKAAGEPYVIRFLAPAGETITINDLVLGESTFEADLIGDTVIARADGSPLYNFANVIDDADMKITHVIRGNDHVSNTPKQVMIYEALGEPVPKFAHLPMIMGEDGAKLSKRRHHTANVEQLAEDGYVPDAVLNGLALIGWARDGETTVMTVQEMIEAFDVENVKKSNAAIDYAKLRSINGDHLRMLTEEQFAAAYAAWRDEWLPADDPRHADAFAVTPEQAAFLAKEKVEVLGDVPGLVGFLAEPHEIRDEAWERLVKVDEAPQVLDHVIAALEELDDFSVEAIEEALRGVCTDMELKPRVVFGPVRFAVTGRTVTPGLFESIAVLGRDRALARLREARSKLAVA